MAPQSEPQHYFEAILGVGIVKVISAVVALGLSAAVVAKTDDSPARYAAIALLATSAFHFFPFALCISHERRKVTVRPPIWYIMFLVLSTVSFASASIAMLVIRHGSNASGLWKRARITIPIVIVDGGVNVGAMYDAAAAFGLISFLACLGQWYCVISWIRAKKA